MARRPSAIQPIVPSVLDRLLDDNPGLSIEGPRGPGQLVRELKQAIRRDLENLLNTRRRCLGWPADLTELAQSLVNYGIPDLTAGATQVAPDPDALLQSIAEAIERFEPRLREVRVEPLENKEPLDRTLRFRIQAVLYVDPLEEPIAFNSTVEPSTGAFQVQGETR
jgi:type VI secretion system protein ImpF